jgi:hypothetical protein
MALSVTKADVWEAEIADQPGELAAKLEALAAGGVNMVFLLARRRQDKPGVGQVYVAGVKGAKQARAAAAAGFVKTDVPSALRVEGADKPGACHRICRAVAGAGINMRGMTASPIGKKFVTWVGFDSPADAAAAAKLIRKV